MLKTVNDTERWGRLLVSVWRPTKAKYPLIEIEEGGADPNGGEYSFLVRWHGGKAYRERCYYVDELLERHREGGNRVVIHHSQD